MTPLTPLLRLLLEKLPFLLLSAAACVVTILAQKNAIGFMNILTSLRGYETPWWPMPPTLGKCCIRLNWRCFIRIR